MDQFATSAFYRSPAPGQPVIVPASAQRLTQAIAAYAAAGTQPTTATNDRQKPSVIHHHSATEADVLRGQLAQLAPQLYELLDPQWRNYLALAGVSVLGRRASES